MLQRQQQQKVQINGKQQQLFLCFSGQTLLFVEDKGLISLRQLQIGQRVLTMNALTKKESFTKIISWLRCQPSGKMQILKFKTKKQKILGPSEKHLLVLEDGSYQFAQNVIGKKIAGSEQVVESIERQTMDGIFAPLTEAGTYLAFSTPTTKILAHSLSYVKYPDLFFPFVKKAVLNYDKSLPANKDQIHQLINWVQEKAKSFNDFGAKIQALRKIKADQRKCLKQ